MPLGRLDIHEELGAEFKHRTYSMEFLTVPSPVWFGIGCRLCKMIGFSLRWRHLICGPDVIHVYKLRFLEGTNQYIPYCICSAGKVM